MEERDPLNLIITGVGGQGNVLISQLIGRALVTGGYHVTIGETYGASQRGGAVMSHLRISQQEQYGPLIPLGQAHVVLGLEPLETLRVLGEYGNPAVTVVANSRPIHPLAVTIGAAEYPDSERIASTLRELAAISWFINATEIALELGSPILTNMVMLGALVSTETLPLGREALESELRQSLAAERVGPSLEAFRRGMDQVRSG